MRALLGKPGQDPFLGVPIGLVEDFEQASADVARDAADTTRIARGPGADENRVQDLRQVAAG